MQKSRQHGNIYEADPSIEADILSLFSSEAAAIRKYTCLALAKDLNMMPHTLQQIVEGASLRSPILGPRFFAKHLHEFA